MATYVLISAALVVIGAPFTPPNGTTIQQDFPPDMDWVAVTGTPPAPGSSYTPSTGAFTPPVAVTPANIPVTPTLVGVGVVGGSLVNQFSDGSTTPVGTPTVPLAGDASGTTASNMVAVQRPAYAPSAALTAGATLALPAGFVIYPLTGNGAVVSATIKLPPSPVDKQIARIALQGTLVITTLTVQDANGNAVASVTNLASTFSSASFQFENNAWIRVGS